jgi:hypothetical protein
MSRIGSHIRRNFVGYLALSLALGGSGAWAAAKVNAGGIAKNAVRPKHIQAGAVTEPKIAAGAVTAAKLAPGAVPTVLWAKVENNFGTASLVQGSGATGASHSGNGETNVTFNRDIRGCSYQATGWLNSAGATSTNPLIMLVERNVDGTGGNAVDVQAYNPDTAALDTNGNYDFSITVFC